MSASDKRFPDEVVVALHGSGVTLGCLPVRIDGGRWCAALFYVVPPDAPCLSAPTGQPFVKPRTAATASRAATVTGIANGAAMPGAMDGAATAGTVNGAAMPGAVDGAATPGTVNGVVATGSAPSGSTPAGPARTLPGAPFAVTLEADLHDHEHGAVIELGVAIATPGAPLAGSVLFLTGHSGAHFDAVTLLATQPDLPLFIGDEYCRLLASQRIPLGDAERGVLRALLDEAVGHDAVVRMTGRYDAAAAFDAVLRGAVPGGAGPSGAAPNGAGAAMIETSAT